MKPTTTTTTKRTTTTRRTTTTTAPPPPPATTTTPSASCNEIVKDELCDWQYGKLAEYKKIWTGEKEKLKLMIYHFYLGAECQALCRAVNGAVYFSHYNKVSDPADYSLTCPFPSIPGRWLQKWLRGPLRLFLDLSLARELQLSQKLWWWWWCEEQSQVPLHEVSQHYMMRWSLDIIILPSEDCCNLMWPAVRDEWQGKCGGFFTLANP